MPLHRLTFIGISPSFLEHSPQWPRSAPTVGRLTPAHFDNAVGVSYAREDNPKRWFVVWRREVGFQPLQAPSDIPGSHDRRAAASGRC